MGLNIWLVLGGIGIFLFGIQLLENSLKNLMSRSFKLFLKKQTSNPFKAIFGGAVVTAILQSSSAVNFMVLAFVSTGVITMRNAFAVIMGTNLGTTLTGWIVASLGFKMDIESIAYPIAGVAGLLLFSFSSRQKLANICHFLMGFSFLFIGLGLLKESMEGDDIQHLFENFTDSSLFVFLLLGFVATTITQASSATVAITLSILNQQLIGFESAIAIVIGSEVGTSIKLILGALDGVAVKKRVAVGNLIYNIVTTILAFAFLKPLALFITENLSVKDPLMGLVTFQTGMNLLSIVIFLPFINIFSKFLERLYKDNDSHVCGYLTHADPTIPHAALELMKKETAFFIHQCKLFNLRVFDLKEEIIESDPEFKLLNSANKINEKSNMIQYEHIKEQYGEIQSYYIKLIGQKLNEEQINETDNLIACVRSAMYSSKCIKDLFDDLAELRNSANEMKFNFVNERSAELEVFYKELNLDASILEDNEKLFETILRLLNEAQNRYSKNLKVLYSHEFTHTLSDVELATLMNFSREIFTSNKSMIMTLKYYLSDYSYLERFNEVSTYHA
ncbi:MAG: Na/Pi cotransporter family protein [Bacteroidetes bacterium]|jgi:phosphate:Na+ symporter|nr:Na/Pi cotransporter family protein [Bacteroidota bacterium]